MQTKLIKNLCKISVSILLMLISYSTTFAKISNENLINSNNENVVSLIKGELTPMLLPENSRDNYVLPFATILTSTPTASLVYDVATFCIPAQGYSYPTISGTATLSSTSTPYSWRRIADHVSAKIAFIVCFVNGVILTAETSIFIIISELICLSLFLYCYYMSDKYCNKNIDVNNMDPCWWKYHALFHSFSVCAQMLIIYSV